MNRIIATLALALAAAAAAAGQSNPPGGPGSAPPAPGSSLTPPPAAATLTPEQRQWLAPARRHAKAGWIYLHIEGDARARGFQHGYLLAPEIADGLRAVRTDWEYQSAMPWTWLVGKADALFTRKIDKENLAELGGIAEGLQAAGVATTRAELIAYNGYLELSGYWWPEIVRRVRGNLAAGPPQSCSAFIATGHATADGGVVLGHNTMTGYQMPFANLVIDVLPARGHRILMQSIPGWIHSGTDFFVTDAGLVGAETTIGNFQGFDPKGTPEFARMRRATQDARSIDEWCGIMKRGNNGGYANAWLLGDINTREIARLELGLRTVGFERKRDGCFTGSNVAEDLKILRFETTSRETDISSMDVSRRVRWKQLMAQYAGRIDLELAKRFEADHYDTYLGEERIGGRSLCAHGEEQREPIQPWPGIPYAPDGTVDGKVVDTALARRLGFAARWGAACGRAFDAPKFLAEHPQFEWMKDILRSRPSEPWVEFTAGEPD